MKRSATTGKQSDATDPGRLVGRVAEQGDFSRGAVSRHAAVALALAGLLIALTVGPWSTSARAAEPTPPLDSSFNRHVTKQGASANLAAPQTVGPEEELVLCRDEYQAYAFEEQIENSFLVEFSGSEGCIAENGEHVPISIAGVTYLENGLGQVVATGSSYSGVYSHAVSTGIATQLPPGAYTVVFRTSETIPAEDTWQGWPAECSPSGQTLTCQYTYSFVIPAAPVHPTPPPESVTEGGGAPGSNLNQPCTCDPVNTATGEYFETDTDISFPGPGPALAVSRTYGSFAAYEGRSSTLGVGWSLSLGTSLQIVRQGNLLLRVTVKNENGSSVLFEHTAEESLVGPAGLDATLVHRPDGTYLYTVNQRELFVYSSAGRLMSISDLNGNAITLTYEGTRLASASDNFGRALTFHYTSAGKLSEVTDSTGRSVKYIYNSAGLLEEVIGVRGGHTRYGYNAKGWLTTRTDPDGHLVMTNTYNAGAMVLTQTGARPGDTTDFTYGANYGDSLSKTFAEVPGVERTLYEYEYGRLARVTEGLPGQQLETTSYSYNAPNLDEVASETDPRGNVTSYEYDGAGNVTKETDPEGGVTTYRYDGIGDLTGKTDPDGHSFANEYDTRGNLVSHIVQLGGGLFAITSYTLNAAGQPTKVVDPDGHEVSYTYDVFGQVASVTDGLGDKTTESHDARGELLTITRPKGNVAGANAAEYTTTDKYDAAGDLERSTDGKGHATAYTYDEVGNRLSKENALGATWKWEYDASGDLSAEIDPEGHATKYGYGPTGLVSGIVLPGGSLQNLFYNDLGHLQTKITSSEGTTHYKAYDGDGNLTEVEDPSGTISTFTYSPMSQPLEEKRNGVMVRKNTYDLDGNRLSVTNGSGAKTSYSYGVEGRVATETSPAGGITRYAYDRAGNLERVTDPQGRATTYSYDAAQRLSKVSYSSAATHTVTYSYDPDSERIAMSDGSGSSTFEYDPLGRMVAETNGGGQKVTYGYDAVGRVTSIGYPGGHSVSRGYDPTGQLTSVTDWLGGTTKFAYNSEGQETVTEFPAATGEIDTAKYAKGTGFLQSIAYQKGENLLGFESYGREEGTGRINSEIDSRSGTEVGKQYGYDAQERLTVVTGGDYAYDASGDPITEAGATGYQYNSEGQLTQAPVNSALGTPAGTYAYESLGQRSEFVPTSGTSTHYAYDQAGDLTEVTHAASGTPAISEKNVYNGEGLPQTQSAASGESSKGLLWDTQEGIPTLLAEGTTSIVYGPGQLPVEQIEASGLVLYYHHDQQGSTRLLTSSVGAVVSASEYSPYGVLVASLGTQPILGYDGQYTDRRGTGLIYLRARWYDPRTGEFISKDPLRRVTAEPYGYAAGNPLGFADPSGMSILGDIGGAIGSAATWAYENPGQVAESVAGGVCVFATDGLCLAAVGGSLGVVSFENSAEYFGGEVSLGGALAHEGLSVGETALIGGSGLIKAGLGASGQLEDVLPVSYLGNVALNGLVTWPSAVGIALENKIEAQVECK